MGGGAAEAPFTPENEPLFGENCLPDLIGDAMHRISSHKALWASPQKGLGPGVT